MRAALLRGYVGGIVVLLLAVDAMAQQGAHWTSADADHNGRITTSEFGQYLSSRIPGISEASAEHLASLIDANDDGMISDAEYEDWIEILRGFVNGDDLATAPTKSATALDSDDDSRELALPIGSDEAALLLITSDELAHAWLPFAEWKTLQGKPTRIITVRQIEDQYEGPIVQEKIRRCIRDHIDNRGTRWVMLGGDCTPTGGHVPGGHTTVHRREPRGIPTDIVYLSPTDWDADGDGIYGEWRDDRESIVYPDGSVGLGRVPVRTAEQIDAFTKKVIEYESEYPTNEFAERMMYTCTDSPAYPKVRASWDRHVSTVWEGEAVRFFSRETPWDEDGRAGSYDLTDNNLVTLINDGAFGKIHIHGHGLLDRWILERSAFDASSISKLRNDGAYPLITTVSCFTGEYDSSSDPCIVESMIRAPSSGSVAVVAPVRTGKPHFHSPRDYRLMVSEGKIDGTTMTMTAYWSYGLGGDLTTGEALMKSKDDFREDALRSPSYHLCLCELNLLGDPTLDMRAHIVRKPSLDIPGVIGMDTTKLAVQTDAPGSLVCVWKDLEIYETVRADEDGLAEFTLQLSSPGFLRVTIAGPSMNTRSSTIRVE